LFVGIALCVLAGMSCGNPPTDFTVPATFTTEEKIALRRAAEAWNTIAPSRIELDGGAWRIERRHPPTGYIGWTDGHAHIIVIEPSLDARDFYATVLHELGHSIGLRHIPDAGVMNAVVGATAFSTADLAECRRSGACP
jgi:hypothetical protein